MRFMLNLDSAGGEGRKGVIFNGHPELEPVLHKIAKEVKSEMPTGQRVSPYGDLWPFFVEGIPGGGGGDPDARQRKGGRGYGHTRYDTVDKIKLENLRLAAANYSRFLFRIANMDDWPAEKKTEKDIAEFIKEKGYEDTIRLTKRVKEYVSKWKEIHPETKIWLETTPTEDLLAVYVPYKFNS